MGFGTLFEVASMPMLQVLMISILGAFMATDYMKLLPIDTRKSLNRIVFVVFTPSLVFSSLAKTVNLGDIISWWFMPVNVGLAFLFGGIMGLIVVKILKPKPHLEGLVIATCSYGNIGNLLLILIPAICKEDGSPFGDHKICSSLGLSYTSFSMAIGALYLWTYTYQVMRSSRHKYKAIGSAEKVPNKDLEASGTTNLLEGREQEEHVAAVVTSTSTKFTENQVIVHQVSARKPDKENASFYNKLSGVSHQVLDAVLEPPTIGAMLGFIFGTTPWLRSLIIGRNAPLRVIQESALLLGGGTIPCITLILGGNLIGTRTVTLKPSIVIAVIIVRYTILPIIGIGVVTAASNLGLLPPDPLFHFMLMIQFALPPAMSIGTMAQLFDIGQEECSVIFLWTYLVASFALTVWSTFFMWILS